MKTTLSGIGILAMTIISLFSGDWKSGLSNSDFWVKIGAGVGLIVAADQKKTAAPVK